MELTAAERLCTCPLACFVLFYWQLAHAGFHTFSGTFAAVLASALNNSVLVYVGSAHYS